METAKKRPTFWQIFHLVLALLATCLYAAMLMDELSLFNLCGLAMFSLMSVSQLADMVSFKHKSRVQSLAFTGAVIASFIIIIDLMLNGF